MAGWTGWVAALGGLISLGQLMSNSLASSWYAVIGGIIAIVFGIWAAMSD
jgi:hypothetical protein